MNLDLARNFQFNFQDNSSPLMCGLIDLHHNILFLLLLILGIVTYLLISLLIDTSYQWIKPNKTNLMEHKAHMVKNSLIHGTILEIVWTIVPSIILFIIAVPSFSLLYSMEEILDPELTVKVIANQWYWHFELGNLHLAWDSYLIPLTELKTGQLRLLTVDNPLFLPVHTAIRFVITSNDVIHAFSIPSLGLKVDAVPGRLNQLSAYINRTGIYYGQCSELCGVNHGFMPIELVSLASVVRLSSPTAFLIIFISFTLFYFLSVIKDTLKEISSSLKKMNELRERQRSYINKCSILFLLFILTCDINFDVDLYSITDVNPKIVNQVPYNPNSSTILFFDPRIILLLLIILFLSALLTYLIYKIDKRN